IVMGILGLPIVLIAIQPAFGSAASFFPLVGVAMFFGGIKPKYWVIAIVCVLIAAPLGFHVLKPFQRERIMIFLDPARDPLGSGYQVMQAKIATGSGGITGKGYLHGTQVNLAYLPARHTDFIFSVLGEEWGFAGVSVVLTLYLFLIVESLAVAQAARDRRCTFRRPVTVLLLMLTTVGIAAVTIWFSGKSYSKVDPIPFEDLHTLRHVMSRHPVSTHILAVIVVPIIVNTLLFVPWGFFLFIA